MLFCDQGSTATLANRAAFSTGHSVGSQKHVYALLKGSCPLVGGRVARAVCLPLCLTAHASSQGAAPFALWPRAHAPIPGQGARRRCLNALRCSMPHHRCCGARVAAPATAFEASLHATPAHDCTRRCCAARYPGRRSARCAAADAWMKSLRHTPRTTCTAPSASTLRRSTFSCTPRPLCSDAAAAPGAHLARTPSQVQRLIKPHFHIHLARNRPRATAQIFFTQALQAYAKA